MAKKAKVRKGCNSHMQEFVILVGVFGVCMCCLSYDNTKREEKVQ